MREMDEAGAMAEREWPDEEPARFGMGLVTGLLLSAVIVTALVWVALAAGWWR
jgi:hypothetical protein